MSSQLRSTFAAIAALVRTQLVTVTGIPAHHVFFRLRGRRYTERPVQVSQYLVIRPHAPTPIPAPGPVEAGGRGDDRKRRVFEIVCRTRIGAGQVDRDDVFLLREEDGHLALEDAVLDALQLFIPEDSQGNILVAEPIRQVPAEGELTKDEPLDPQWGETVLYFEVRYEQAVNQARQ